MSEPDDDIDWVASCLRGDPEAFEPLVRKYERQLFRVAYRLVGNYDDALDVTQNTFIKAYEKLDTFDRDRRFFSWVYRIAVNEGLNLRRGRRPEEPLGERVETSDGPLRGLEAREARDRVQAAIERLTEDHRHVVVLRHFAELSYEEIAEALDLPEKTVKSRLFSARQRLAALLVEG